MLEDKDCKRRRTDQLQYKEVTQLCKGLLRNKANNFLDKAKRVHLTSVESECFCFFVFLMIAATYNSV